MKAEVSERERCITAQVVAFTADPLLRWMLPDPTRFLTFFPRVLRFYGGRAFDHGSAYRSNDFAASAFWLPPGIGPDEEALGAVLQESVDPGRLDEVFGVLEACDRDHHIAYLEASNPRNVPLYQRFGLEVIGEIQMGSSPLVVPMRRAAR